MNVKEKAMIRDTLDTIGFALFLVMLYGLWVVTP